MALTPMDNKIVNILARAMAARGIRLPCALVPRLAGVRAWTPTAGRIISVKMRMLSHVLPMHLSAADEFPRVNIVSIPVSVAGRNHELPVLFDAKHDQKRYDDKFEVMSGGRFWEFPVYWPVMSQKFEVLWKNGLHQIPSLGLIALSSRFNAQITVQNAQTGKSHEMKSKSHEVIITPSGIKGKITEDLLGLVELYIPFGARASVQTKGSDAAKAMEAVRKFFNGFTEEYWYKYGVRGVLKL